MKKLLDTISCPQDIHSFSSEELDALADEVRARIIEVLSQKGGHLASNIGSVETIVALHKVFNSPTDKIIFDTSHQIYPHKILTDRNKSFHTIRQYQGLCGFASPKESPHDHFYAGHAGTALSLALGVAAARDLVGGDEYILPFLGDAAFSCGLTLEALNNLPKGLKRFIILLNDNDMFISDSTGNINNILRSYALNRHAENEEILNRISKHRSSLSSNYDENPQFFEQFGLHYIGIVDGHDVNSVANALAQAKELDGPVVVHTLTIKGQGLDKAEGEPTAYHGVGSFDPETGNLHKKASTSLTFPKVFGKTLLEMGKENPNLVAVTPAMPHGACLTPFMKTFPERCFDVGIAEGHSVTFAAGLAYQSKKQVLVSIYATFLQRALDNLFQDVCLQEIPVVFALDRGGFSPADGSTHHGIFDIGFLKSMPNMIVAQPRDGDLLSDLLQNSFSWNQPVAIRYPNQTAPYTEDRMPAPRPVGKGEILRQGDDLVIIALGHMCRTALQVADLLACEGISATVVDPIFIKPLDAALFLELLLENDYFVTIEEHSVVSGLGSILSAFIAENDVAKVKLQMFGVPDKFVEHGDYQSLLQEVGLTPEQIAENIHQSYVERKAQLTRTVP